MKTLQRLKQSWEEMKSKSNAEERSILAPLLWLFPIFPTMGVMALPAVLTKLVIDTVDPESVVFSIAIASVVTFCACAGPALVVTLVYLEMYALGLLGRADLAYKFFLDELSADPKYTRCPPFERGVARMLLTAVGPRPK